MSRTRLSRLLAHAAYLRQIHRSFGWVDASFARAITRRMEGARLLALQWEWLERTPGSLTAREERLARLAATIEAAAQDADDWENRFAAALDAAPLTSERIPKVLKAFTESEPGRLDFPQPTPLKAPLPAKCAGA